jgi:D-alanyl-D-alanine carboxypeptidase (penicillin-binding protein 5/6)
MRVKKYFHDKFPGADGVKTGYTRAAGHCFVGSATRDGRRLLSVVLGSYDSASRDTIPLLSWGFKRFPNVIVAKANETAGTLPLPGGTKSEVAVSAVTPVRASADSTQPIPPTEQVRRDFRPLPNLVAPVRKGQVVGTLAAIVDGKVVSESNLIAAEDVEAAPVAAAVARVASGGVSLGWVLPILGVAGTGLVAYKYATATAKSTRRRRNRVAAAGRGTHRGGPR